MSKEFDNTGVCAALSASQLKTLVKTSIKKSENRTSLETAQADIDEARNNLELYQERANREMINTVEDLSGQIDAIQELLDDAKAEQEEAGEV